MFLQSNQAGLDNSAQKLKNTNSLAVFDHFGGVKYKIFGASGGFAPGPPPNTCPVPAGSLQRPQTPAGLGNDLWSLHDWANTFFIYILAGSYDICRVVTAGVLTFFGSKNDSAPALLYSKYCAAPEGMIGDLEEYLKTPKRQHSLG